MIIVIVIVIIIGSWTVLSFDVENPYERINQLESWFLPSDDTTIDSSGVIGLRTDRAYDAYYYDPDESGDGDEDVNKTEDEKLEELFGPKGYEGKKRVYANDIVIYDQIMDTILRPGELGVVVDASNTSDMAGGSVYTKDSEGMISIVDGVRDKNYGDMGEVMAWKCQKKFGFSPFVLISSITNESSSNL